MVDDHVDRPGVEVRQRMKLTGTNSSIGLIVPIARAHHTTCSKQNEVLSDKPQAVYAGFTSFSKRPCTAWTTSCALPTWWLWRGGCTRSLSEHGRETPLRPWYFVSRRGRVGRCQVCKAQLKSKQSSRSQTLRPKADIKGRSQAAFRVNIKYRGVEQPGSSSGS